MIVLYNAETGVKISKGYDLKGVRKQVLNNYIPFDDRELITEFAITLINLYYYCQDILEFLMEFLFNLFSEIDPDYLPELFSEFHHIPRDSLSKFHLALCKKFEKCLFGYSKGDLLSIVYNWIYRIGPNQCSCGLSLKHNSSLPNSPGKLLRLLTHYEPSEETYSLQYTADFTTVFTDVLTELQKEEKNFFVSCKIHNEYDKNIQSLLDGKEIHSIHENCCKDKNRVIAAQAYLILGSFYATKTQTEDFEKGIDISKRAVDLDSENWKS